MVSAQRDLAVWTLVLHALQTVHAEGEAEAGPEHGEAEDEAEAPGHHAGLAAGAGCDLHLTARTLQPGGAGA